MKSLASLLRIVTMALILAAPLAHADDDSLPLPSDGTEEEVPFNPPPQDFEDNLSTGEEDALPEPMGSNGSSDNVVNSGPAEDDIFLPTPQAQPSDSTNYAPISSGTPVSTTSQEDGADWRYGWSKRPIFTAHGGISVVNYPVTGIDENIQAPIVGASVRVWDIGQTVFLHAYGAFSWVPVGGVGPFTEVKDAMVNFGPMIEVGIGRRLSLFGSILRRNHNFKTSADASRQFGNIDTFAAQIAEDKWVPGLGIGYDFYVVPHGSLGIRAHVEQDVAAVLLTMSIEPAPRKRLSLNFNEEP